MALTCPHCNAQLRGSATQRHTTTPECRGEKKSHGCLWTLFILFLMALCLVVGAYIGYQYHHVRYTQQEATLQELARRIAKDEEQNKKKLADAQQDSTLWAQTFKAKTIEAVQEYIATYPEGFFIDEAYMLMEELQRRQVKDVEQAHIKSIVANRLTELRQQSLKSAAKTLQDVQYNLTDTLHIIKKHITRDSFLYIVEGNVQKVSIPTGKAALDTTLISLRMTLDKERNIIESNLASLSKN